MIDEVYRQNVGWEDKIDADSEAKRLADYCAAHTRCAKHHHRPVEDIEKPCPVCGSCVPFLVEAYPV
jgi:hypothetical protein